MKKPLEKMLVLFLFTYLVINSIFGFQRIAWGTGEWWGEYSFKWGVIFLAYGVFCMLLIVMVGSMLLQINGFQSLFEKMAGFRARFRSLCWLLALLVLAGPIWFFQYTAWGVVFTDVYIRVLAW